MPYGGSYVTDGDEAPSVRCTFAQHVFGVSSKRVVLARHPFRGGAVECLLDPRDHRRSGALMWTFDGALFVPSTRFIQRHQGQFRTRRHHAAPDCGLERAWQDFFVGAVEVALAGPSLDWVRAFRVRID